MAGKAQIVSKIPSSKRRALNYLAAELRKGRSVAALHGRRYAEYVHHVRQVDLIQCAQLHQHLAVLTVLKFLPTFQSHQAIYVVDWAEVRSPGGGNNPDNPVILVIVGLRENGRKKDSGDMLNVFRHVCLLKSNGATLDTMSHLRRCWPLHDPCFNVAMVIHATSRADGWVRRLSWPLRFLRSGGSAGNSVGCTNSWLQGLSFHFGVDVADYFAWIAHYVNCLWFLGVVGFIFTIIRYNVEERDYDCYVQPVFSIVLMLFVAAVIEVDDPFEKVVEAECFGTEPLHTPPQASRSSSPSPHGHAHDGSSPLKIGDMSVPSTPHLLSPISVKSSTLTAESSTLSSPALLSGSGQQSDVGHVIEAGAHLLGCAGEAAEVTLPAGPPAHDLFHKKAKSPPARDASDSPAPCAEFETEQAHAQAAPHAGYGIEQPGGQSKNHQTICNGCPVVTAAHQETAGAVGGELQQLSKNVADELNDLLHDMMDRPAEFTEMAGEVIDMYRALHRPEEPWWMRWAKTLMMVPLMGLYFLAVQAVFVLLFWFEMWVIFSWGQCTRINEENGDEKCTTPVIYRGEWAGFFMEILPSVSEGILLELLMGVSKAMSAFVCDRQNWSTQYQYEFAFFIQCVLFEMSGKVGFVMVLAFVFVPDWTDLSSCKGNLDYFVFGNHALSCIKNKVSYKLRRRLLQRSMKGPMLVSMLVAMLVKVILPRLITDMLRSADTDFSILEPLNLRNGFWCLCRLAAGACCSCWRCFWRLAGLIFLFDCEAVGGPQFMLRPLKPPRCGTQQHGSHDDGDMQPEGTSRKLAPNTMVPCVDGHEPHPMPSADLHPVSHDLGEAAGNSKPVSHNSLVSELDNYGTIQDAFYQGMRKEFCVLDEYLEQLLHFTFFTFFGMVWPLGCTFALMNYLLEFRFDILKLGYVRRRSLPKPDQSLRRLIRVCTRIIAYVSIVIQVALMLLSFQQLQVWLPYRFGQRNLQQYTGEWVIAFVIMVIGMVLLSWMTRWLVKRLRLWRYRRRLKAMAEQVQASPSRTWGTGRSNPSDSPRRLAAPSDRSLAAVVPTPVPPWQY